MAYSVVLSKVAEEFLDELYKSDRKTLKQIIKKLNMFASANKPRDFGKLLQGDYKGIWRYRVGDYRILCDIQDGKLIILVIDIDRRKDVYD